MILGRWKLKYRKKRKKTPTKEERAKYNCYRQRNSRLSELGYVAYAEYLRSDDWKKIRQSKLDRFPTCLLCERPASQVHHLDYSSEVLLGMYPQLLVTMCEKCHEEIEFDGRTKRSLVEANACLQIAATRRGLHNWIASVKRAIASLDRFQKKTKKRLAQNPSEWVMRAKREQRNERRRAAKRAARKASKKDKSKSVANGIEE